MTEFRYLLYKKQELKENGVLPKELRQLFGETNRHGVTVIAVAGKTLPEYMKLHGISPESVLVIAATDQTLRELAGLSAASIGYLAPAYPFEDLYQADILAEGFQEVDYDFLERIYQRRHGIPWRVIETGRCYLREMTLSDLPELYALYRDADFSRYIEPLHPWEEEVEYTKAYIEHMYRFYGYGMWLIRDRFTDELIGRAGYHLLELNGESFLEMGYAVAPNYQRKGYATEVCRAMIAYAKEAGLGYSKVHCFVQKENRVSLGLLEKLGFVFWREQARDGKEMLVYVYELNPG